QAERMSVPARVLTGVTNMAQMMAEADFAFGAAGTTTWERCSLGLPSLLFVLAKNQRELARAVHERGAAVVSSAVTSAEIVEHFTRASARQQLIGMANAAQQITDGNGVRRVIQQLLQG